MTSLNHRIARLANEELRLLAGGVGDHVATELFDREAAARRTSMAREVATARSWSLAAGIDIFTLARRMGTSVKMIDRTYGHLVAGADAYERELLDAFDEAQAEAVGRAVDALEVENAA